LKKLVDKLCGNIHKRLFYFFCKMYSENLISHETVENGSCQQSMDCSLVNNPRKDKQTRIALRKLYWVVVICGLFMGAEFAGGYMANSISLYADAFHMLSDLTGFLVNIFGLRLTLKTPSSYWTYGYHRVEIVASIFSIFLLWILAAALCFEAAQRIQSPPAVDAEVMVITASCGIISNFVLGCILGKRGHGHSHFGISHVPHDYHRYDNGYGYSESGLDQGYTDKGCGYNHHDSKGQGIPINSNRPCRPISSQGGKEQLEPPVDNNITIQSALLHALGDLLQNVGALIAGILIWYNDRYLIMDPICTFFFAFLVFVISVPLVCRALYVLMETVPKAVDPTLVIRNIKGLQHVKKLRDIHIWNVGYNETAFTAKVNVACDCRCNRSVEVTRQIGRIAKDMGIKHCIIEIEVVPTKEVESNISMNLNKIQYINK